MASLEARRIADIDCHVITSSRTPRAIAVFCHGFGAPGDDLVSIGAQLLQSHPALLDEVQIVFPSAPLSLESYGLPFGRAWWPLDTQRLIGAVESGNYRDLRRESPQLLPEARRLLLGLISQLQTNFGLPMSKIVLGGFSQGAMLATDVSLHLEDRPAGLVVWSGALINEEDWKPRIPRLRDVPVIQSHGQQDPILPFEAAVWLRDLLIEAGASVRFIGFPGPHTIPPQAMQATGQLLVQLLEHH